MADKKKVLNLGDFDFGFSLATADDLEEFQQAKQQTEALGTEAEIWKAKAEAIYASIQPLLTNLSGSPEKSYIYWPGEQRIVKIDAFKQRLREVLEK